MTPQSEKSQPRLLPWGSIPPRASSILTDLPIAFAGMALFYGLLSLTRYWTAPVNTQAQIDLSPSALPTYALYSVARLAVAYLLSLVVSLIYGYVAAHSAKAERVMIPLLDTLQSIPVLCFLPPVMIFMVALFPTTQLGVELGSIFLIFTGQVWNMAYRKLPRAASGDDRHQHHGRYHKPPGLETALHFGVRKVQARIHIKHLKCDGFYDSFTRFPVRSSWGF